MQEISRIRNTATAATTTSAAAAIPALQFPNPILPRHHLPTPSHKLQAIRTVNRCLLRSRVDISSNVKL
jgi:hypothetical protein